MKNIRRPLVNDPLSTFDLIFDSQQGQQAEGSKMDDSAANSDTSEEVDEEGHEHGRYRHQCRPKLVLKLANLVASRQDKEALLECFRKTGFSDVLKIADWGKGLNKDFVIWVVENFEANEMQIRMNDRQALQLHQTDAHRVYNIPLGGKKVDVGKGDPSAIAPLRKVLKLNTGVTRMFKTEVVLFAALKKEKNYKNWSRLAVLYLLGVLLCPGSHGYISLVYAEILLDFDSIMDYNWSGHILDHIKYGLESDFAPWGELQGGFL